MSILKNVILEVGDGGPGTAAQSITIPYNDGTFPVPTYSVGGATDTLGATLTGAQIKSPNLRLKLQVNRADFNPGDLVNCDFVRVSVWYDVPPNASGPCKVFSASTEKNVVAKAETKTTIFRTKKRS